MQFIGRPPAHELTYSDVFLVPSRSDVGSRLGVRLDSADGTGMHVPVVASNMNAVTGPRLAAAVARRGGLGVLPQDLDADSVDAAIAWVKSQDPLWDAPFEVAASTTVEDLLTEAPSVEGFGAAVRADDGALLGVVELSALARMPGDAVLGDLVGRDGTVLDADRIPDARAAFDALHEAGVAFASVERDGELVGVVSAQRALRGTIDAPNVDADRRLSVAVALGVSGDPAERARRLVAAGADVLVLDTAHGHQAGMLRALETVRSLDLGVPLVAGNVVTSSGTRDLVEAGATIVKVGVGPGAMCTTRMMTAVGRPQFSAVLECAETAGSLGAHVWADGGVRYPRDVALALAAGASAVMVGSWFAGTVEAPGVVRHDDAGRRYKESFGMASSKAVRGRFGGLDAYELARKALFAEGISSSSILIDPLRPSVEDLLDMITSGLRSSMTYAGAADLRQFGHRAKVGVQSAAGYEEGKALPVSW